MLITPLKGREALALPEIEREEEMGFLYAMQNDAKDSVIESHSPPLLQKAELSQTMGLEENVRDVGLITFCNKSIINST